MGKKKKNFKNIKINQEDLSATTIGLLPSEQKGPIFVLILFALLLGIVFFLPDIMEYINNRSSQVIIEPEVNNQNESNNYSDTEKIVFYDLRDNLTIKLDNVLLLDNFKITNNTISFDITNNGDSRYYFNRYNYFLELYNENNTLLERVILEKEGISKDFTQNYSYSIATETATQAKKIVFVNIPIEGYFNVELVDNILTCKKDYQTITYKFLENKLININDVISYSETGIADYKNIVTNYQNQAKEYNNIDGFQSNFIESSNGFTMNTNVDLNKADISKIKNKTYYNLNTEAKIVNFEMEARGFSCN